MTFSTSRLLAVSIVFVCGFAASSGARAGSVTRAQHAQQLAAWLNEANVSANRLRTKINTVNTELDGCRVVAPGESAVTPALKLSSTKYAVPADEWDRMNAYYNQKMTPIKSTISKLTKEHKEKTAKLATCKAEKAAADKAAADRTAQLKTADAKTGVESDDKATIAALTKEIKELRSELQKLIDEKAAEKVEQQKLAKTSVSPQFDSSVSISSSEMASNGSAAKPVAVVRAF